jgi:hypothetical protein
MTSIALTSGGSPALRDAYRAVRRHLPAIAAVAAPLSVIAGRDTLAARFAADAWDVAAFYSAIFDWSSIQSAFLFGIYAFVLSRSEPFIKAVDNTEPFEALRSYSRRTLYLTFVLTIISMPLAVASPKPAASLLSLELWTFAGLSSLMAYTFCRFLKVVRVFGKIEGLRPR